MKKVSQLQLVRKNKQEGATMIEYAVIAALVVVIALFAFPSLKDGLKAAFDGIVTSIKAPTI